MSTRSTRRPQAQPLLTPLESLLLAQAAWQLGAGSNSWPAVAKLLSKHPLLSRPKSFFTAQSCHAMYEQLMKDAELDLSDSNDNPQAPMNLKLAEKHYLSRHTELRELILAEESKFKTILKEIEDIRAGLWDKKIQAELTDEPEALAEPSNEDSLHKAQPSDEVFDGSELSGVSESADSSSSSSQVKDETSALISNITQNELQEAAATPTVLEQEVAQITTKPSSPSSVVDMAIGPTETVTGDEDVAPAFEEIQTSIPSPFTETPKENIAATPTAVDSSVELVEETVDLQQNGDVSMENQSLQGNRPLDKELPTIESVEQLKDQKQEEEEEEINQDDSTKEEEEEASQGRPEDIEMDTDQGEEENRSSPKSSGQVGDVDEANHPPTPEAEAAVSEAEPQAEEDQSSASEEPVVLRKSTRRRKSSVASVPLPTTRKRLRSQARLSESELQAVMDSENEDEDDVKDEETPQPEDDPSSPFDGAVSRRREGKRKASFMDSVDSPIDKKRMREDSEPVDEDEPGPSSHNIRGRITRHGTRTEEQVALKRFQNVIGMLHSQISQHRNGNIFHNPIKNSEAPDYHEIVKRPMDLKTIKTRVKDGLIANSLEFQRDIFLMFANSMMYNRPGSDVYAMAEDMMLESEGQITAFRQTEGLVKRGQRQA